MSPENGDITPILAMFDVQLAFLDPNIAVAVNAG
jgi:hypothetical protein